MRLPRPFQLGRSDAVCGDEASHSNCDSDINPPEDLKCLAVSAVLSLSRPCCEGTQQARRRGHGRCRCRRLAQQLLGLWLRSRWHAWAWPRLECSYTEHLTSASSRARGPTASNQNINNIRPTVPLTRGSANFPKRRPRTCFQSASSANEPAER